MKLLSVAEKDVLKMRLATAEKIMAYNGASPDDYRALRDAADALDAAYGRAAQLESEPDEAMVDAALHQWYAGNIGTWFGTDNAMKNAIAAALAARKPAKATCDNDSCNCEYSRTNCEADGSFRCLTHPDAPIVPPSTTSGISVAEVEAARNVLKKYRVGRWHINGKIVEEALAAARAARKPADTGAKE